METKLLFFRWADDDELKRKIVSDAELIRFVDEMDFTGVEIVQILDITDPNNIYSIYYVGWQPNCLIEFADSKGNVVLSGYGTDH